MTGSIYIYINKYIILKLLRRRPMQLSSPLCSNLSSIKPSLRLSSVPILHPRLKMVGAPSKNQIRSLENPFHHHHRRPPDPPDPPGLPALPPASVHFHFQTADDSR
ncbi:C6 transcription factor (Leu3) [Histoplasma ohiense]|nr:C6 transcription factor (Leu3) [Histoplasma ohiense (nom. inval.)]